MKKIISLLMAFILVLVPVFSASAAEEEPLFGDYYISEEDFLKLEHVSSVEEGVAPYASGLIASKSLGLAIDGNNLVIQGTTVCTIDVKKCGFTHITLQRYENGAWKEYVKFEDLYNETNSFGTAKYVAAARGYNYRVTAKHYAKKSIFSTEKIDNVTASIYF